MLTKRFITFLLLAVIAQNALSQSKGDTIPPFLGITFIPSLNWNAFFPTTIHKDKLKYNFEQTTLSSYEGSFGIRSIGMRVGLSAQVDDNLIGKIQRYGGYIGLRGFWLKLQGTKMSGSVNWLGSVPPGFTNYHTFSNNHFTVDLLKSFKKKRYIDGAWKLDPTENQFGFYWGIGYTRFSLPVIMSTMTTPGGRENQIYAVPAFDTLFMAKYYTLGAGFDMLRQFCLTAGKYPLIPEIGPLKLALYASTQDKIGFGSGKISNYGKEMSEALNPGKTLVGQNVFSTLIQYNLSVGLRYFFRLKPIFLVIATGYDLEGAAIVNMGAAADTNTDLGWDSSLFFLSHGVSFKIYLSWIGK